MALIEEHDRVMVIDSESGFYGKRGSVVWVDEEDPRPYSVRLDNFGLVPPFARREIVVLRAPAMDREINAERRMSA